MLERNSEVNSVYDITEDKWVLTLARKLDGSHPQHAFLILEGIQDSKAVIWFMDLVGQDEMAQYLPNITESRIRIKDFSAQSVEQLRSSPLLYRCSNLREGGKKIAEMMDLQPGDKIATGNPSCWHIGKEYAENLIASVKTDKSNPPPFNIFGKNSVLTTSSASSSSKEKGHNCFTYAKEKINQLKVRDIRVSCNSTAYCMEHLMDMSSFTLTTPIIKQGNENKPRNFCPYFSRLALIGGGMLALGVVTEATRRYYLSSK